MDGTAFLPPPDLAGKNVLPGSEHKEENRHSQMLILCHGHVKAFCLTYESQCSIHASQDP